METGSASSSRNAPGGSPSRAVPMSKPTDFPLPAPVVLKNCLRVAGLEGDHHQAEFILIHGRIVALLCEHKNNASRNEQESASVSVGVGVGGASGTGDTSTPDTTGIETFSASMGLGGRIPLNGAGIMACALLLHRLLESIKQSQSLQETEQHSGSGRAVIQNQSLVTDVVAAVQGAQKACLPVVTFGWSIHSSLDALIRSMLVEKYTSGEYKSKKPRTTSHLPPSLSSTDSPLPLAEESWQSWLSQREVTFETLKEHLQRVRAQVYQWHRIFLDFERIWSVVAATAKRPLAINQDTDTTSTVYMKGSEKNILEEHDGDETYCRLQLQLVKRAAWKLALSDCMTQLDFGVSQPQARTEGWLDRHQVLFSSVSAISCVVTLCGCNGKDPLPEEPPEAKRPRLDSASNEESNHVIGGDIKTKEPTETGPLTTVLLNDILSQANDILKIAGKEMTAKQLKSEITRLGMILQNVVDKRNLPLVPSASSPSNTKGGKEASFANRRRTYPVYPLTFLHELLGVTTCETLAWHLTTLTDSLYQNRFSATTTATSLGHVDPVELMVGDTSSYLGAVPDVRVLCAAALTSGQLTASAATLASFVPRPVTPVVFSEALELNEWAVSVSLLEKVRPSAKLLNMIRSKISPGTTEWQSVMVSVLNKALLRLSQEHVTERTTRKASVVVISKPEFGLAQVIGDMTPDKQLCKSIVALFFHALEAILFVEISRFKPYSERFSKLKKLKQLLLNETFLGALVTCCCSCVIKAIGFTQKLNPSPFVKDMQIYSMLHITGISPFDFMKVSEKFLQALSVNSSARDNLGSPLIFCIPRMLQKDIRRVEVNILDSLIWTKSLTLESESFMEKIVEFQQNMAETPDEALCLWPPQVLAPTLHHEVDEYGGDLRKYPSPGHVLYDDFCSVSDILRKILRLANQRITELCASLQIPSEYPVASQVWVAFRYLMRNHIDLVFDRHLDHWILCSLYGVCRTLKYVPELKFTKIIESYIALREQDLGAMTCQRIIRHIKLYSGKAAGESVGNIINLYNVVFVPAMKQHLLNSASLKRCTIELETLQSGEAKDHPSVDSIIC